MPTTNYVWDEDNILYETDGSNAVTAEYTYSPQQYGNLLSEYRSGTTSTHYYDAQGSTLALTSDAGTVSDTFAYTAWGEQLTPAPTTPTPFRWIGQVGYYWDVELALQHVRARSYGRLIARWTTTDPSGIKDGCNLYKYVYNAPNDYNDPLGLEGGGGNYGGPGYSSGYNNSPWAMFPGPGLPKTSHINPVYNLFCICTSTKAALIKKYGEVTGKNAGIPLGNQTSGGYHDFSPPPGTNTFIGSGGADPSVVAVIYCPGRGVASFHFGTTQAGYTIDDYKWPTDCVAIICGGQSCDKPSNCLMSSVVTGLRDAGIKLDGIMNRTGCYRGIDGWYFGTTTEKSCNEGPKCCQ